MKTWQRHIILLKTQDEDVPTTRNVFVNYFHRHSTLIYVQVNYTTTQNDLIPQKHLYLIYFIQSSLWILKYGYPASKIVINSRPPSRALILCITPFYLKFLLRYGHPNTISYSFSGIMRYYTNGHIGISPLCTVACGCATSTTGTYIQVSPS